MIVSLRDLKSDQSAELLFRGLDGLCREGRIVEMSHPTESTREGTGDRYYVWCNGRRLIMHGSLQCELVQAD